MRRQVLALGAGIGGIAIVAGALLAGPLAPRAVEAQGTPPPVATAQVVRKTLDATTQVNGTLGYASSYGAASDPAYSIANEVATAGTGDPAQALQGFATAQSQYDAAVNALESLRNPRATDLAQAQAQIAQVQAALVTAQQAAAGATPAQVAQAKAQLAAAQSQLTQAQTAATGATPAQISQAQAQLAQAEAALVAAQNAAAGATPAQIAQAQAAVTQAQGALATDQAALVAAQTNLSTCRPSRPDPSASPGAQPAVTCDYATLSAAVQAAQNRVNTDQAQLAAAQAALDALTSPASQAQAQAQLASAQAQEQAAKDALAALSVGPSVDTASQLAAAQAGARSAQAALDALLHGDTRQAQAQLASASAQLNAAQTALYYLLHPTDQQLKAAQDGVSNAKLQLDAAQAKLVQPRGTLTQLAAVGSVVRPGGVLYTLDGLHPVVLLDGQVPAWRDLEPGITDGPDVLELETNLEALGFAPSAMKVDAHWDDATTAAVKKWQASLHVPQTGAIPLGQVVFEPGELRITSRAAALGATLQQGTAVLTATSTQHVVSIALDPAPQTDVRAGDAVTVELPDGSTATGKVSEVGTVATAPSSQNQAPNESQAPTIDVTVTLDDPTAAGTLDQAPVTVDITTATASNVLAVPIPALVQLLEGGYAVQVDEAGTLHYVPVTTGLFASGWVEVSGPGLREGQTIVVAQ